jgi:hypothetical protein
MVKRKVVTLTDEEDEQLEAYLRTAKLGMHDFVCMAMKGTLVGFAKPEDKEMGP